MGAPPRARAAGCWAAAGWASRSCRGKGGVAIGSSAFCWAICPRPSQVPVGSSRRRQPSSCCPFCEPSSWTPGSQVASPPRPRVQLGDGQICGRQCEIAGGGPVPAALGHPPGLRRRPPRPLRRRQGEGGRPLPERRPRHLRYLPIQLPLGAMTSFDPGFTGGISGPLPVSQSFGVAPDTSALNPRGSGKHS